MRVMEFKLLKGLLYDIWIMCMFITVPNQISLLMGLQAIHLLNTTNQDSTNNKIGVFCEFHYMESKL